MKWEVLASEAAVDLLGFVEADTYDAAVQEALRRWGSDVEVVRLLEPTLDSARDPRPREPEPLLDFGKLDLDLDPKKCLVVEAVEENREVVPLGRDGEGNVKELAVGATTYTAFVRAPSGKLFAINVPAELAYEIGSAV